MRLCEIKFIVEDRHLDEKLRRLPDCFKITDDFLYDRLDCIRREFYNEDFYAVEVVNDELFLLLVYMMRSALSEDDKHQNSLTEIIAMTSGDLDINAERRLALVVEYIETHISDDITLEVLSEKFHFDKSYLTVKFKELWGCSPMRYVARARLERAKALLLGSSLSVTDIASKVGFTSIHYFSRYFKAKYGISPAVYRSVSKSKNISKK
jgi:YesN/AraC family two-component response regulator